MFPLALRLGALGCIVPGLTHLLFGAGGDWLIGLAPGRVDPSLDSQNRFYGAIFVGYGAALWWAAAEARRHYQLIRLLLAAMALGAVGRGLAWLAHGAPTPQVLILLAIECLIPPALWFWLERYRQ
jgi:hypothetical protein